MRPEYSPINTPHVTCSKCSQPMRREIGSMPNGKFLSARYSCDTCECTFVPSTMYLMGEYVVYEAPKPAATPAVPQENKATEPPAPPPLVPKQEKPKPNTPTPRPKAAAKVPPQTATTNEPMQQSEPAAEPEKATVGA